MKIKRGVVIGILLAFIGLGKFSAVSAEETGTSEKIAVSLVIDTSGSMAETDPTNLRKTAADIFVDLLSPEDYVGIVSFSTDVTELAPMQQVGDAANKQNIKASLAPIVNANGNTNYQLALQKAEQQLDSYAGEDVRKVIIFLTDGVPEPDYALAGRYSLHDCLHGIALADDCTDRIEKLCRICTWDSVQPIRAHCNGSPAIRAGKPNSWGTRVKSQSTFLKFCAHSRIGRISGTKR